MTLKMNILVLNRIFLEGLVQIQKSKNKNEEASKAVLNLNRESRVLKAYLPHKLETKIITKHYTSKKKQSGGILVSENITKALTGNNY